MSRIAYFAFIAALLPFSLGAQRLSINSTLYISPDSTQAVVNDLSPAGDDALLFAGSVSRGGKGMVPPSVHSGQEVVAGRIAKNKQFAWIKLFGTTGDDRAIAIRAVAAPTRGYALLMESRTNTGDAADGYGNGDFTLIRLDTNGNTLWAKSFGSTGVESPRSFTQTPDGGFLIGGITTTTTPDHDVTSRYSSSPFSADWLVVKTDSSGNKQWSHTYGGTGHDFDPIVLCGVDGYYLVGTSLSKDHDCTDASWHAAGVSISSQQGFVLKLDTSGTVVWGKSYGCTDGINLTDALWDQRDSTIAMCGFSHGDDYLAAGNHGGSTWPEDMLAIKTDKEGHVLWHQMTGTTWNEQCQSIKEAASGGYILYGQTLASTNPPVQPPTGVPGTEALIAFMLDSLGNTVYYKAFGNMTREESPTNISPFQNGYAAGGEINGHGAAFSEGANGPRVDKGEADGFISFLDYQPASVPPAKVNTALDQLSIRPNPAERMVFIGWAAALGGGDLTIADAGGKEVYQTRISGNTVSIDIGGWPKGTYLVNVHGRSVAAVLTSKFVIR